MKFGAKTWNLAGFSKRETKRDGDRDATKVRLLTMVRETDTISKQRCSAKWVSGCGQTDDRKVSINQTKPVSGDMLGTDPGRESQVNTCKGPVNRLEDLHALGTDEGCEFLVNM
jgi:hypothetical protein